ncbi:MAG: bifunctional diguanylate cyclase/phosphodiesterase, partial [Gammaproteobacteria bacterium]|nr:bifunctional diguanylate cyclase/phosphodiesterase [Gammaproteobacteria bacterium]
KCVREIDTVARLGGDEFLLILSQGSAERLDVTPVTTRILSRFAEVFIIDGQEVSTTASLGVAIYPGDGEDVDTLTSNADIAMYQSKSDGRHAFSFFSKDLAKGIDRRMQLEAQLRNALGRNELSLHYQPIIHAEHGRTVKFEALLRWQCEALGPVYPDEFIPVAESTGLILPIGGWVLEQVCEKLKDWRARGHKKLRAAVNISASQFSQSANLANTIADMLEANGLPPDALEIEITEGLFLHETPAIFNTLQAIREMGIGLSLDDFGTGYSALSYLRRFDFNVLKIDRSFVQDVLTDERDATLVNAIIAMAHGMGLEVVAEGAEEEAHIRFLRERNCDYIQGYFFSRPLPEEAFLAYLNEESKLEKRFPESSFVPLNRVASEKS